MEDTPLSGLPDRIRERMDLLGLNPYSAAKKAGLGADFVRDILRGRVKQPSAARLGKLAEALECSLRYLMGYSDADMLAPPPGEPQGEPIAPPAPLPQLPGAGPAVLLPIKHELFAETYRKATDVTRAPIGYAAATLPQAYADREQWYEIVRDDSADIAAPNGSIVHVVSWDDEERDALGEGDLVIVTKRIVGPDAAFNVVERSLRIVHERYPDVGLWFLEHPTTDLDYWGLSDDVFRKRRSPEETRAAAQNISQAGLEDLGLENPAEFLAFIEATKRRQAKVVGKVIRVITPTDPAAGFGVSTPPASGRLPKFI